MSGVASKTHTAWHQSHLFDYQSSRKLSMQRPMRQNLLKAYLPTCKRIQKDTTLAKTWDISDGVWSFCGHIGTFPQDNSDVQRLVRNSEVMPRLLGLLREGCIPTKRTPSSMFRCESAAFLWICKDHWESYPKFCISAEFRLYHFKSLPALR